MISIFFLNSMMPTVEETGEKLIVLLIPVRKYKPILIAKNLQLNINCFTELFINMMYSKSVILIT